MGPITKVYKVYTPLKTLYNPRVHTPEPFKEGNGPYEGSMKLPQVLTSSLEASEKLMAAKIELPWHVCPGGLPSTLNPPKPS